LIRLNSATGQIGGGAVSEAVRTLLRAGAEASMVEDFRAIAEATAASGAPRYREHPVLENLGRFLVRGAGGPNRDAAFYELCHLVNAVDASENGRDRRNTFFLGPEQATSGHFRARLDSSLAKGGWRRPGFARTDEGVSIRYADGEFTIRFGRMPFLAALYEFLAGMDAFGFYGELNTIFDDMTRAASDVKAIQTASNRIASRFRQYRRRYLAQTRQEGKFDVILGFVLARSPAGRLLVDDAAVLDFWSDKSSSGDFRSYRTVFDAFANFLRSLDEANRAEALARAVPIGIDRENGEVEPDDSTAGMDELQEWISPLALLDQGPAAAIKFFKKEGERKPMEYLMHYGPTAIRLPLAFLRLESFGPVQSAITTDLQIGRGRERVESRAACTEATPYCGIVAGFESSLENVKRLQKAAFYALHKSSQGRTGSLGQANVVALRVPDSTLLFDQARASVEAGRELPDGPAIEKVAAEAGKVFRSVARKGFDEAGLADDARIEGFRVGAQALLTVGRQIERYLAAAGRVARGGQTLEAWFDVDRRAFRERFRVLYGVSQ
jgi:hypothetical protein